MGRLGENAYRFEGETDVYEAIEAVCRDFRIDRSRIVLRGHSLGAVGAWQLGLKRPDRFVAIGPAAGPVDTIEFANSPWKHFVRLAPLTDWQKPTLHLIDAVDYIANAAMIPVVAAMGDKDPYFSSHLLARSAFAKERLPFIELVDPGAGHGISDRVMQRQLELLSEHADRGINPFPKHIRFVTWTVKYSRCHWVEILGLQQHYARAQIDAHVARDGSIRIEAPANITRFAIHPPAAGPNLRRVTIDGQSISLPELPAGETKPIVIETRQGAWACPGTLNRLALKAKRPGLQGPIDDAFATRFICVRGTAEAWHPDVGAWAEANLNRFADEWRRYYCADLPIKDDSEITADDLKTSNLILFGDPKSNRWIKTILPQLPLRWTQDQLQVGEQSFPARDHGLQLIYPNPLAGGEGRYVVFNSGHTYHKQELQFSYMVFPRLGDWAVMKLGNNKLSTSKSEVGEAVVTSGFFGEDWELKSR
jgi:hypothetical protein